MAAPMKLPAMRHICKLICTRQNAHKHDLTFMRHMGFISSLRELVTTKKPEETQKEVVRVEEPEKRVQEIVDGRRGIEEHKPYTPPENLMSIIQAATANVYGDNADFRQIKLTNRFQKFNFLTQLIDDLDHDIPNVDLHEMNTVDDVINYFSKEIADTSTYEDLAKLNLPKNLHMNIEPIRFHPDTDTIFDGKTAFPGRPTKVTSVKYKRKYKGYDGGDPVNSPWEFKQ